MMTRLIAATTVLVGMVLASGCSATSGASTGFNVTKNLFRKDSNLRVFLDGEQAKQSTLRKGLSGYAPFVINKEASTSPVFRYEIIEPKKFGFIKSVTMQVHQKFEADFSDIPDYVIYAARQDSEAQMKPNVDYDLGNLGPDFKILDKKDKTVDRVAFVPGVEYLLVLTLSADKSESVQIYFKTR
ncbi:MAG: hypothetical protein KA383_14095 [Phycisphaerae bacterium]|nr:hypothetical protein [Phycisphaerae bacterium]